MSIITTYPLIGDVAPADLLIIADMSILGTPTRTVSIQQIADEIAGGSYSWFVGGTGGFEVTNSETVTFTGGIKLTAVNNSGNQSVTFNHDSTSRTDTTSAVTPGSGGTFTVIDSIVQDATGHTTLVNTKTVTMPSGGGGSGSVTSVDASTEGDALDVFVSNPTTTPDLAFTWAGTNGQYVNGEGNLADLPATATTYDLDADQSGLNVDLRLTPSSGITDIVKFTAGAGIALTETGNNNITIAASGSGGLTSVGASSNYLTINNSPLTSNGVIQVNVPVQSNLTPGTYTNATVTVDQYGFVTNASSGTGGGMTQWFVDDGGAGGFAVQNNDSVTVGGSTKINVTTSTQFKSITWTHANTTRNDTTSVAAPAAGGTFTVIDSITQDATGHPTAVNVKTVTLPAGGGGGSLWANTTTGTDIYNTNYNGSNASVVIGKATASTDTDVALEVSGRISQVDLGNSVFIGFEAGLNDNLTFNTCVGVGYRALKSNTSGTSNIAIGSDSLLNNTTGGRNIAFGTESLEANISGTGNMAMGFKSLESCTNGQYNTGFGENALSVTTSGLDNIAIGRNAGRNCQGTEYNVFMGSSAGTQNTTANKNTGIGYSSLLSIGSGSNNTAIGSVSGGYSGTPDSGNANESSNSVYIGADTVSSASGNTNEIVIGYRTIGKGSNTATIGNDSITETYLKGVVVLEGYTFATLPASPVVGMRTYITDGGTPTYGGNASGGGSNKLPVFYNGSNWIYA